MTNKILFPRAFAFAVDDLGWNEGSDLSRKADQGPHRTGVKRLFDLNDYQYMVDVGKAAGTRVQCLFILSEMDRENILAKFPTTTYQRGNWDNRSRVNEQQKTIMNFVRDQSAFMEFGLHGTGHEYWAQGEPQKRAEWYNLADRRPWPEDDLRSHIECFKVIMTQYGFSKNNGHSFPESFVPCAYSYYWNPQGEYSLGKLLTEAGVKYANTDFSQIPELNPPQEVNGGGFDFGTHVINRINYGNVWYELSSLPRVPIEDQQTDIIESHWPNWLAQDDFLQSDITQAWINYYRAVQRLSHRYVAKNTEQLHSQWLYNKFTTVNEAKPGTVEIDNTQMPGQAYRFGILGNMVLKIKLEACEHISSATINGELIPAYYEDQGYGFLYLPVLKQARYILMYSVGSEKMPIHIFNDETYNVYSLVTNGKTLTAEVKVYGLQTIRFTCKEPDTISSSDQSLAILNYQYDLSGELTLRVRAADMQGTKGKIIIRLK